MYLQFSDQQINDDSLQYPYFERENSIDTTCRYNAQLQFYI